jgi:hypothetical protein
MTSPLGRNRFQNQAMHKFLNAGQIHENKEYLHLDGTARPIRHYRGPNQPRLRCLRQVTDAILKINRVASLPRQAARSFLHWQLLPSSVHVHVVPIQTPAR